MSDLDEFDRRPHIPRSYDHVDYFPAIFFCAFAVGMAAAAGIWLYIMVTNS